MPFLVTDTRSTSTSKHYTAVAWRSAPSVAIEMMERADANHAMDCARATIATVNDRATEVHALRLMIYEAYRYQRLNEHLRVPKQEIRAQIDLLGYRDPNRGIRTLVRDVDILFNEHLWDPTSHSIEKHPYLYCKVQLSHQQLFKMYPQHLPPHSPPEEEAAAAATLG